MRDRILTLTERERATLRLLLAGHDAKSIACHHGLSVHTINERLRDARRKLGVTSSRAAARLLAEVEGADPDFLGDDVLGVEDAPAAVSAVARADRQVAADRIAWLSGGMLVMSVLIAAVAIVAVLHGGLPSGARSAGSTGAAVAPSASAGQDAAKRWLALLDGGDWERSWRAAADVFRSRIPASQWAATIRSVRQPLGSVASRVVQSVTQTDSLPGAPTGEYEVIQYRTDFSGKPGATETVTLARGSAGWKVAGYFIR